MAIHAVEVTRSGNSVRQGRTTWPEVDEAQFARIIFAQRLQSLCSTKSTLTGSAASLSRKRFTESSLPAHLMEQPERLRLFHLHFTAGQQRVEGVAQVV